MPIASEIRANLGRSSWIRRMFEEGRRLREAYGNDAVFDFSLGNPDLEPPEVFLEALEAAAASRNPGAHSYMPNAGYASTRARVAEVVGAQHGVRLSAEDVVMTVGAAGGLNVLLHTILDPGDEVLVTRPYFAEYWFYAANHRATLRDVDPGPDFSLSVENIRKALNPRTACVLVNSPNNPTGRVYGRDSILELAEALEAHGRACGRRPCLILDEPYRAIVYGGATVPAALDAYAESIVVSSYSKSLSLPGERIGFIAASPGISERKLFHEGLAMSQRTLGFVNAPALMQRALERAVDATCEVSRYEARRDLLCRALDGAGIEYARPDGAFYLFCRVPEGGPEPGPGETRDVAFAMHLKERRILGVPGAGFGYPDWFRLCYCVPERSLEAVAEPLRRAAEEWRS